MDKTKINQRRLLAYSLRQAGLKWREIGERLGGVSPSRAAQLAAVGERIHDYYAQRGAASGGNPGNAADSSLTREDGRQDVGPTYP